MRSLLALAALVLTASPALAQNHRDVIVAQLDAVAAQPAAARFTVDRTTLTAGTMIGLLPKSGSVIVEVNLQAGKEYFIAAGCDSDCSDLDTRALAPDSETVLAEDVGDDDVPMVTFRARQSGPHLLSVIMSNCSTDLCYFGVRVFSR